MTPGSHACDDRGPHGFDEPLRLIDVHDVGGVSDPDDARLREEPDQTIGASDDRLGTQFPDKAGHRTGDSLHLFEVMSIGG